MISFCRVQVRSPRPGESTRPRARDWGGPRSWARACVVRGDTTEQQPRTCEWDRAVARYLAFNGRRSGARLAPAVLASHRRRGTDRGRLHFFSRDPRHIAPLNYRLAEASANPLCIKLIHAAPASHSRSTDDSCWFHNLIELTMKSCAAAVGAPRRGGG